MYQTLLKPLFADVKTFVLDTLFPIHCLACEKENREFICVDCKMWLKKLEFQRCVVCQKQAAFGKTHPGCMTPRCADGLIGFYDYHDKKVAQIIIKGKYNFLPSAFRSLAELIAPKISADHPHLLSATPLALSPIPLHTSRHRWRGFNQAEILCRTLSAQLNLPIAEVLQRQKATQIQKDLKKDQRLKNVRGAFKLKPGANVDGQNLILVDDVATTGATLLEAAGVLKRNGAKSVWCLTVARD
ncbi:MAG: phosphoribosyltransferase family protein [Candidatus Doudnabacteria bacterium]|nr:phosphoribosyltransferase family protein [Candidatus Doudnabacteria bacterium]